MTHISRSRILNDKEAASLQGVLLDSNHYDTLVDSDVEVRDTDTGACVAKLVRNAVYLGDAWIAYRILSKLNIKSKNRGHASLRGSRGYFKRTNGNKSRTDEVDAVVAPITSIVGFYDRYERMPYCRQTIFTARKVKEWQSIQGWIRSVDEVFKVHAPDGRYDVQRAIADATSQDFVIPNTAFTTMTVNKNWQTACHQDAGDLKEGFGVMSVLANGKYDGCYLVIPAYRVAFNVRNTDIILFDSTEWHGNTSFIGLKESYNRVSVVHYYRKDMVKCGTAKEELDRAKRFAGKGSRWD